MTIFIKLHLSIIAYNAEKVKRIRFATNLKRKYVHTFSGGKYPLERKRRPVFCTAVFKAAAAYFLSL